MSKPTRPQRHFRFNPFRTVYEFYDFDKEDKLKFSKDAARVSASRSVLEKCQYAEPWAGMKSLCALFDKCRTHPITIVFGNLGRQPYLLTYYLDLCFGASETISVWCKWKIGCPYQQQDVKEPLDFMIVVEPYFGYTVLKPPNVKHVIVFTSHLCLETSGGEHVESLHLPVFNLPEPTKGLTHYTVFQPPIFHETQKPVPPGPVQLDVSNAKSTHEAFLRLMTGREMVRPQPYTMLLSLRDQEALKHHLHLSIRNHKQCNNIEIDEAVAVNVEHIYYNHFL